MTSQEFILALARTTLCTSLAAGLAWYLLARFQIASPRVHRVAWLLVVAQGWFLVPWTYEIEAPRQATSRIVATVEVGENLDAPSIVVPFNASSRVAQPRFDLLTNITQGIGAIWIIGSVTVPLLFAGRYIRFARRVHDEVSEPDQIWQAEFERQVRVAKVRRSVELQVTPELGPLLCWLPFRYLVLVPGTLWKLLTRPEREAIVRHELAHLLRGDLWKSLLIRILALPQWFNPLVWRAVRAFDEAGEWACDDLVANSNRGGELVLARSLVRAGEFSTAALPGTLAAQGGVLSRRIRRLVAPDFKEESKMKKFVVIGTLAALVAMQLVRIERVAAKEANGNLTLAQWMAKAFDSKEYLAKWDRASLGPYSIEPPDILRIKVKQTKSQSSDLEIDFDGRYQLNPDGHVDLGRWGSVDICGLTAGKAAQRVEQHLRNYDELSNVEVSIDLAKPNSKVVYFLREKSGRSEVVRMNYEPGSTVSSLLRETAPSNSIDFASAKIWVSRCSTRNVEYENVLPVIWNAKDSGPTTDTDRTLKPGDRVHVRLPGSWSAPQPLAPAVYASPRQAARSELNLLARKPIFVILQCPKADSQEVVSQPVVVTEYDEDAMVSDILSKSAWPHPVDFAKAEIAVHRPKLPEEEKSLLVRDENDLRVAWDTKINRPTAETDYRLFPGDRIFVTVPTAPPTPAKRVADRPRNEETPSTRPVMDANLVRLNVASGRIQTHGIKHFSHAALPAPGIVLDLDLVKDAKGSLAEFESLRGSKAFMTADSDTILPALRILAKNGLIKKLASPRIICNVGQTALIECGSATSNKDKAWHGFRIEAMAQELENALSIRLKMESTASPKRQDMTLTMVVAHDETLVIRADWWDAATVAKEKSDSVKREPSNVYVVITPRLIK